MAEQESTLKRCSQCRETKPAADFARASVRRALQSKCRSCASAWGAEYRRKGRAERTANPSPQRVDPKRCSICRESKEVSEFCIDRSTPDGLLRQCRKCKGERYRVLRRRDIEAVRAAERLYRSRNREKTNATSRKWRASHPEEQKEATKRWRREHPEKRLAAHRRHYFKHEYGLSIESLGEHVAEQGNRCAICNTLFGEGQTHGPHVDHDHTTGQVRGLLCKSCNLMLGYAKDDIARLDAAIEYLLISRQDEGAA